PEATKEDAQLYLELLRITQQTKQAEARRWVFGEFEASNFDELDAKYPRGSAERDRLINVLTFYESAGVLVSRGLLDEDVFFDSSVGLEVVWPRVEALIDSWQRSQSAPAIWENVVWLGRRLAAWREERWKPKLEAVPPDRSPATAEPSIRGFAKP